MLSLTEKSILATLAYYDCLDFPLTKKELVLNLINPKRLSGAILMSEVETKVDLKQIEYELDKMIQKGLVGIRDDYYFLNSREYLFGLRLEKQKIAVGKWLKARKAIYWLQMVPYLRAVFASGSLATSNTDRDSDLDVLAVVSHGRIWLTRVLVSLVTSFLGVRRRKFDKIAPDKICLNHYITDRSLHIPFYSLYNAQTYINLVPILLRDKKLWLDFKVENGWAYNYILDWSFQEPRLVKDNKFLLALAKAGELILNTKIGDWLEFLFKKIQSSRIKKDPSTYRKDGRVVFNDNYLAFHPDSPERRIIDAYNEKMIKLGLEVYEKDSGLRQS